MRSEPERKHEIEIPCRPVPPREPDSRPEEPQPVRPKGSKIRVGFLSAYFRDHTIGRLNLGRIQELSRSEFEVTVISLNRSTDAMTEAFRTAADRYLVLPRHVQIAREKITELELDILIFADIGMDALTQSLCYSRMAPIQAATWGHPDTSGSPAIDYYLSSALAEPDGAAAHYTERLELLPGMGVYYHRPKLSGLRREKESFGLRSDRHTYLCPQTSFKFHPDFDASLRAILELDPEGELVVMEGRVAAWTEALQRRWASVLPEGLRRVKFIKSMPQSEFLHLLAAADVILDPYPFCGGNTSYEAFAVGTPVVTHPGRFLRGRLTYGMYRQMGLGSMIAASAAEYAQKAVELGCDAAKNQQVRRELREAAGALFENRDEVRDLERALRRWVEQGR